MAETKKRYYWLKLKDDFFRQKEIKQLRRVAGGEVFIIIYLKMLLRSLKDDGRLYYEGIDADFVSELALDIDEEIENVRITVAFLESKGLLVQSQQDEYELPAASDMTASEGYSAERMRRLRNKRALSSQSDALPSHSDTHVTLSDEEIDIEKREKRKDIDIDIDPDRGRGRVDLYNPYGEGERPSKDTVFAYASSNLVSLSHRAMEEIVSFAEDLSEDVVRHAIDNALDNGVRTWAYVKSILNRYMDDGVKNLADAKAADDKRKKEQAAANGVQKEKTWDEMTEAEQNRALNSGPFGRFY